MMPPLIVRLLAASVPIASRAGRIVRQVLSSGKLGVINKGHNDPQTEADRAAQKLIFRSLRHQFPQLTIIGEEKEEEEVHAADFVCVDAADPEVMAVRCPPYLSQVQEKDLVVWVDPLDGTKEFTEGQVEAVTVLMGMSVAGKAVAGLIHQPFYETSQEEDVVRRSRGRTLWGLVGNSSPNTEEESVVGGIQVVPSPSGRKVVCTTRSHSNERVQAAVHALQPDLVLRVGGAGHKVVMLLEGTANAYVYASPGTKKWDTCGPQAVLQAAGGKLTDVLGHPYEYGAQVEKLNSTGIVATAPGESHSWWVERIPGEIKEAFRTERSPSELSQEQCKN